MNRLLFSLKEEEETMKVEFKTVAVKKDHIDYIQCTNFFEKIQEEYRGLSNVSFTYSKSEIIFTGSKTDVSNAKQHYEKFVETIIVVELFLSNESMSFLCQKAGLEFFESCLSQETIKVVLLIESESTMKVVTQSMDEYYAVKQCLENNIRKVEVLLPQDNQHLLVSKEWFELCKAIDCEDLIKRHFDEKSEKGSISLHGAAFLVEKYANMIRDFIDKLKIECEFVDIELEITQFMKERLTKDFELIIVSLKDQHVKIKISSGKLEFSGTKQGIKQAKTLVMRLKDQIKTKTKLFSSVGVIELFLNEHGQRNLKGIEVDANVKIKVTDSHQDIIEQFDTDSIRSKREKYKKDAAASKKTLEPFDECDFTTKEGLKVSWKYGDLAKEKVIIIVSCIYNRIVIINKRKKGGGGGGKAPFLKML